MTEYRQIPPPDLPVDENGWHPCSNCGWMWWDTRVTFGPNGQPQAASLEASCAECGFPLITEVSL